MKLCFDPEHWKLKHKLELAKAVLLSIFKDNGELRAVGKLAKETLEKIK